MGSISLIDRPSSSKKKPAKKFAKNKGKGAKNPINKARLKVNKPNFKKAGKLPKLKDAKGKCFHCQEKGH